MRKIAWAALVAAVVAAAVMFSGYFVDLPTQLWLAALAILGTTALPILVLSIITSRCEGESFWRSVGRGSRDAVRWLFELTP